MGAIDIGRRIDLGRGRGIDQGRGRDAVEISTLVIWSVYIDDGGLVGAFLKL